MTCDLLLVSGSLRARSTNTAMLRTAEHVAPEGVRTARYDDLHALPHFNPDEDTEPLHPAVADLRSRIRSVDGVVFSTPEYAGALPGSFKNLLDWSIGDDQPGSMAGKPVAWINPSSRGAVHAHDSLRRVLGYASGNLVEDACAHIPITKGMVGEDGLVADPSTRDRIAAMLRTLTDRLVADRAPVERG